MNSIAEPGNKTEKTIFNKISKEKLINKSKFDILKTNAKKTAKSMPVSEMSK
jgi:hypothetical protein